MATFHQQKHIDFVVAQDQHRLYEYWLSEHLRLNGLYWGVMALSTMGHLDALPRAKVEEFVLSCWDDTHGSFGAFPRHDAHLLLTLSGLQILKIYDSDLAVLGDKRERIVQFVKQLQLPDGSFQGDEFGEVDTRFVYTALLSLALLGELTPAIVDPAVEFIMQCQNFDGGFGMVPGLESHAAQVFVCVGALAIVDRLDLVEHDTTLAAWLSERQVAEGGFNGRPEKLPDVCYSWWVMLSLAILKKTHWVDLDKLEQYILLCQDPVDGGFSDRPDNQTDIFHTCFGITGLSLCRGASYGFVDVDPVFCMPQHVTATFSKWQPVP